MAILALFLYVVLPFVASTRIVKERIAFEMSMWSGYRVTIGEDPGIKLFPFRAVLTDVKLGEWTHDAPPVLAADEVILNLSPVAALIGDIYFYKVRFEGFVLNVERDEGGYFLRPPGGGRMANAVKDARVLGAANADGADASSVAGESFGRLHFTRGQVVARESGEEIVSNLSGALVWQRLDKSGSLLATGDWHGETVSVDIEAAEPVQLLGGDSSQVSVVISSTPGKFRFDGTLNLSHQPYFAGEASFSTPGLRRMLEWSDIDLGASPPRMGAVSLTADVGGSADRIKLEDLHLTLDGDTGAGVMEVALAEKRPSVSGTLAFQQLNLGSLLPLFTGIGVDRMAPEAESDAAYWDRFDLDLRVSARRATTGFFDLADVAATAQIREGLAVFDISDARAFGGTIQAGLRLDRSETGIESETSLRATDMDGGALGRAVGLSKVIPASRGDVSLLLKGPVERWDRFTDGLSGAFSAEFGSGTLPGPNIATFLERIRAGGFFPLNDAGPGPLAIDRMRVKGNLSHNVADVDQAEIRSGQNVIDLAGVVSFPGRGVALSGTVRNMAGAAPPIGFFVGGTWSEPFISPALPAPDSD